MSNKNIKKLIFLIFFNTCQRKNVDDTKNIDDYLSMSLYIL